MPLPDHHLSTEARDTIKLGIGLVATVTALVLGLMTASAKNTFDNLDSTVKHSPRDCCLSTGRSLATAPRPPRFAKASKSAVAQRVEGHLAQAARRATRISTRPLQRMTSRSSRRRYTSWCRKTDEQRALRARALAFSETLLDARWIVVAALATSVQAAFLTMLVFWLTITFTTFGVLAPRNRTVIVVLFVCALSVAGAIFLVLEMDSPFDGLITVSPGPMNYALEHMNK